MRYYQNKKGQLITIREMILILTVFIILAAFITSCIMKAEQGSQEEICRASVFLRHEHHLKVLGAKIEATPLECYTYDRTVPLEKYDKERDKVMAIKKSIGELVSKTWWMFGEGLFKGNFQGEAQGSFFNFGGDTKLCHVAYRFTINDDGIKRVQREGGSEDETENYNTGDAIFNSGDLRTFLSTEVYLAEPEYHEIYCNNKKDDDSDDLIDEDDVEDCQMGANGKIKSVIDSNCEQKGGVCVKTGEPIPAEHNSYFNVAWGCGDANCFVPNSRT
jgi:hypothetical protein